MVTEVVGSHSGDLIIVMVALFIVRQKIVLLSSPSQKIARPNSGSPLLSDPFSVYADACSYICVPRLLLVGHGVKRLVDALCIRLGSQIIHALCAS